MFRTVLRPYPFDLPNLQRIESCICRNDGTVVGFQDILQGPHNNTGAFGTGDVFNSRTAPEQLAFALLTCEHPALPATLNTGSSEQVVGLLRASQVLEGMRILDLGCGIEANFGRAARALGATVFTADVLPLDSALAKQLNGHVVVDFTHPQAAAKIAEQTGGNFDLVTENMNAPVPESGHARFPKLPDLLYIADAVLADGGIFFAGLRGAAQHYTPTAPQD